MKVRLDDPKIEERDGEFVIYVDDQVVAVFPTRDLAEAWVDGFKHGFDAIEEEF